MSKDSRKGAATAICASSMSVAGQVAMLRWLMNVPHCWRGFTCSVPTVRVWTVHRPLWRCGAGFRAGAGWLALPDCRGYSRSWRQRTEASCICGHCFRRSPAAGTHQRLHPAQRQTGICKRIALAAPGSGGNAQNHIRWINACHHRHA